MKKVVNNLYTHKSNLFPLYSEIGINETKRIQQMFVWAFDNNFNFEVIKYDLKTKAVSLIGAEGWNERFEPIVGDSICFKADGTITRRKGGNQVYHMKETFVSSNYVGFDIKKSEERTKLLNSLPIIKANKSRIGHLKWWNQFLTEYNLPVFM